MPLEQHITWPLGPAQAAPPLRLPTHGTDQGRPTVFTNAHRRSRHGHNRLVVRHEEPRISAGTWVQGRDTAVRLCTPGKALALEACSCRWAASCNTMTAISVWARTVFCIFIFGHVSVASGRAAVAAVASYFVGLGGCAEAQLVLIPALSRGVRSIRLVFWSAGSLERPRPRDPVARQSAGVQRCSRVHTDHAAPPQRQPVLSLCCPPLLHRQSATAGCGLSTRRVAPRSPPPALSARLHASHSSLTVQPCRPTQEQGPSCEQRCAH